MGDPGNDFMVDQLPVQPLGKTCSNFAAAAPILTRDSNSAHCRSALRLLIHGTLLSFLPALQLLLRKALPPIAYSIAPPQSSRKGTLRVNSLYLCYTFHNDASVILISVFFYHGEHLQPN